MAETAQQMSWQANAFQRGAQCIVPLRDAEEIAAPCEQPSAFLADLAERLATICIEQRGSGPAGANRAVPLPPRPDWRPELIDDQVRPAVAQRNVPPGEHFSISLYTPDGNLRPLQDIEADVIRLAICRYRGRMTEVARRLNIGRSTLYRRLEELGIDHTNYRAA